MKPFLVHVHVYYSFLWPELSTCLKSLSNYDFKLVITLVKSDPELENKIRSDWPKANILIVENLGFDLGPFFHVLMNEDLSAYSYIIKLHTKRDIPTKESFAWFAGARWRNALLKFIRTPEIFDKVLDRFEHHPEIGMHGPNISTFSKLTDDHIAHRATDKFLLEHGFTPMKYKFVAGTMFMTRSELFQKAKEIKVTHSDFEKPDATHEGCQLAHMFERFCGYIVCSQGYKIVDCTSNVLWSQFIYFLLNLRKIVMDSIFTVRITKRNKLLIKILKIPVLAIPLKKK